MANNSINLATLDFNTIKENLKTHLRGQEIFKDYDFDGSNISVLLDVLAYNTSLQAFYMNMLTTESFLDSAQLRSSVVSHAKELNYLPRSSRSARAKVKLHVEQSGSDTLIIPKGTSFTSSFNFQTYTFTTNEVKSYYSELNEETNTYSFVTDEIDIYEGFYVTESFVMNYATETVKFVLSNPSVDTGSIIVTVIEDGGSNIIPYTAGETLLGLDSNSRKYFLQAADQNRYEIIFGDDIIGRRPADGSVVTIQYRSSSGKAPNGANAFVIDADITSDNSGRIRVETVSKSEGGEEAESIASIKYNAPRHFQTQERAITTSDYETLMKSQFPEIDAISVYGGELVNPPQYGRVFIALSIAGIDGLPDSKRKEYTNFIKPKMANPIQPVFVEPTYLYARIVTNVKFNLNVTTLKPDEIRLLVASRISSFNSDNLNDFNATLYNSKLVTTIDDAHDSVMSNITDVYVYKKINPKLGAAQNIDIIYGVPLRNDIPEIATSHISSELRTIYSSPFTYNGESVIIEDDGVGNMRLMRVSGSGLTTIKKIGTVDYDTGVIQINNFIVDKYDGNSIRLYALPASRDITSSSNDIFRIENSEVVINVEMVRN
jgi:hypothetical protein